MRIAPVPKGIFDAYIKTAPSPQNAVDIFAGEWASHFPAPFGMLKAGPVGLFFDSRVEWALQALGGCQGQRVLELGPLEGGHSYMLEQNGAASVTAIEANTRAYLKCLISKEILGLQRTRFLCGDFVAYLQETAEQFDLIFASGVLYHMQDPVGLLSLMAKHTSRLYLWTHYYDAAVINKTRLKLRYKGHKPAETEGFRYTLHRHEYVQSPAGWSFFGGSTYFSHWLERDDILSALRHFGFSQIQVSDFPDEQNHSSGPCFALVASK